MSKVYIFLNNTSVINESLNKREAYCPPGGYFDKSTRQYFESKHQKRKWLMQHVLREAGIIDPDKSPE